MLYSITSRDSSINQTVSADSKLDALEKLFDMVGHDGDAERDLDLWHVEEFKPSNAQIIVAQALSDAWGQVQNLIEHHEIGGGSVSTDGIVLEALYHFCHCLQEKGVTVDSIGLHDIALSIDSDMITESSGGICAEEFDGYSEIEGSRVEKFGPLDDEHKVQMVDINDRVRRKRDGKIGTVLKIEMFRGVRTATVDYGYPIPKWELCSSLEIIKGG